MNICAFANICPLRYAKMLRGTIKKGRQLPTFVIHLGLFAEWQFFDMNIHLWEWNTYIGCI